MCVNLNPATTKINTYKLDGVITHVSRDHSAGCDMQESDFLMSSGKQGGGGGVGQILLLYWK